MKKGAMRKVVIVILVGVILFSGGSLIKIYLDYRAGNEMYEVARQEFMVEEQKPEIEDSITATAGESKELPLNKRIDFHKLKEVNSNIAGWINIPGTPVDYPLLMSQKSNDEYIYTTYEKKYSGFGSIFIDFRNSDGFIDENTVIYGHSMKNGAMFGELIKYGKAEYANEHGFINILTNDGIDVYRVFSAYKTVANSPSYDFTFDTDKKYGEFLNMAQNNSLIDNGVEVTTADRIITLSTCTDTGRTVNRFVVHAKYVETKSE